ncbi:MAG: hypothetical protein ABI216_19795 [Devosia sp.]
MVARRKPLSRPVIEAIRLAYDNRAIPIKAVCARNKISRGQLYAIVTLEGWRRRSPRRVDKHDLTQRLLQLLEEQIGKLETTMTDTNTDQSAVLGKLATTLDRLIATDRATAPQHRPARDSKTIEDIRQNVADRLAQLHGD